jgi:hypothetical protein
MAKTLDFTKNKKFNEGMNEIAKQMDETLRKSLSKKICSMCGDEYYRWRLDEDFYVEGQGLDDLYHLIEDPTKLDIVNWNRDPIDNQDLGEVFEFKIIGTQYFISYSSKYNYFFKVRKGMKQVKPTIPTNQLAWDEEQKCWN